MNAEPKCRANSRDVCIAVLCGVAVMPLYWFFRELVPTADGDRVWRMVEGGVWFYRRSLLAQAAARSIYVLGAPYRWTGIDALHVYSVLSGGLFVFCSVLLARILPHRCGWCLFLLLTAGFTRVFCGHIEYYALVVAATALYLLIGSLALCGGVSLFWVGLAYSFLCWVHLMGWFLFPTVLLLWAICGGRLKDAWDLFFGVIPFLLIFVFLRWAYLFGADLHGQLYGQHLLRLFDVGDTGMWYPLFSVRHFAEWCEIQWICGAAFWPLFLISLSRKTIRFLARDRFVFFYVVVWIPLLGYSLIWHIDLGPVNDWDLFTPMFVPMAWIVGILVQKRQFPRAVYLILIGLVTLSGIPAFEEAYERAKVGRRGKGSIEISGWEGRSLEIYLDGRPRSRLIGDVIMGEHELRVIDPAARSSHHQTIGVAPGIKVKVVLPKGAELKDAPTLRGPGLRSVKALSSFQGGSSIQRQQILYQQRTRCEIHSSSLTHRFRFSVSFGGLDRHENERHFSYRVAGTLSRRIDLDLHSCRPFVDCRQVDKSARLLPRRRQPGQYRRCGVDLDRCERLSSGTGTGRGTRCSDRLCFGHVRGLVLRSADAPRCADVTSILYSSCSC